MKKYDIHPDFARFPVFTLKFRTLTLWCINLLTKLQCALVRRRLRLAVTVLGFASTIILARLLVPADFGLIALGTSMVAALELLTSFRFDVALIQDQAATRLNQWSDLYQRLFVQGG